MYWPLHCSVVLGPLCWSTFFWLSCTYIEASALSGCSFPQNSNVFLLSVLVFRNKLSHDSPEWPGIYYVAQAGLNLSENTVSAEYWSYRQVLPGPARNLVFVSVFWLTSVEWGKRSACQPARSGSSSSNVPAVIRPSCSPLSLSCWLAQAQHPQVS